MLRILLILLICNNVTSDEEESNKYIDLLPEKEKREFLDRIARRILEEIKSKGDPNTSHAEISDEQLDAQAAFVQGILKEESENLKKKRRSNKNNNLVEGLQDKVENKDGNENQDRYIDLTLRTGVRRKRNNTDVVPLERVESTSEVAPQTILVETVYDQGTSSYTSDNILSEDFNNAISKTDVSNNTEAAPTSEIENETTILPTVDTTLSSTPDPEDISKYKHDEADQDLNNATSQTDAQMDVSDTYTEAALTSLAENETMVLSTVNKNISSTRDQENFRKYNLDPADLSYRTTLLTDFEPNSKEISSETISNDNVATTPLTTETVSDTQNQEYNYSTTVTEIDWGSTQKIFESEGHIYENSAENDNSTTINVSTSTETAATNLYTLNSSGEADSLPTVETTEGYLDNSTQSSNKTHSINSLRNSMFSNEVENNKVPSNTVDISTKTEESVHAEPRSFSNDSNELSKSTTFQKVPFGNHETTISKNDVIELRRGTNTSSVSKTTTNKHEERVQTVTTEIFLLDKSLNNQTHKNGQKGEVHTSVESSNLKVLDISKKVLRSDFSRSQDLESYESSTAKLKAYEVYEIAPMNPPFLRSANVAESEQEEQPHYANIYNYDPSNAYFNPYNRLGPNTQSLEESNIINDFTAKNIDEVKKYDDKNDSKSDKESLRSRFYGYNNKERLPAFSYPRPKVSKNINDFMNIFKKVTNDNTIYFHAYDYPDYYLEKIDRPRKMSSNNNVGFPNFSEYDHPYNLLHNSKSVKDHIRATRYLLYLQKRFGYVPLYNRTVFKNKTTVDETAKNRNMRLYHNALKKRRLSNISKPTESPIAMDYYYDRDANEGLVDDYEVYGRELKDDRSFISRTPLTKKTNQENVESNYNSNLIEILANTISKLKELNSNVPISYKSLLVVLGDMIKLDNEDLTNYDWLKTTVDIRAAIAKIHKLIDDFHFGQKIHPKDLELLKYVFYLYKSSKLRLESEETIATDNILRKKGMLPRNKRKRRIKRPLQVVKDFFSFIRDQNVNPDDQPFMVLHELEDILNEVTFQLDDFHTELKWITQSRTHRTYNLYDKLKNSFFKNATKWRLGQVLLHLTVYNLLDLIDNSARSGLEYSFKSYVKQNPKIVDASRSEFIFVLRVLQELRNASDK